MDDLFKFPFVIVDGDNEERKQEKRNLSSTYGDDPLEYDMVFGEAEYPYYDFIGIEDRWLPDQDSFDKALDRKFNACIVRFANVGQILCPWTREKFKTELAKFKETREEITKPTENKHIRVITLSDNQVKDMLKTEEDE